jgi:hypothetical protein
MKVLPLKFLVRLSLLCGTLATSTACAIVNVEQAIIGQPSEGMHTTLGLFANGASGNTVKSSTRMDSLSLWQHEAHTEFLQLQYAYGKSRGQVDTDSAFAHLRHRTAVTSTWGAEAFAQIGRNPFARLTQRTLLGGGARWIMFEENNVSAGYLGLGAFHEQETLTEQLGTTDQTHVSLWRFNSYLILKQQINEQVRVYNTTYYQPAFGDTSDYRILEQASMLVKLRDNLDLKLSLDIAFDSKPPQTVQERDMVYSTGLEFSF